MQNMRLDATVRSHEEVLAAVRALDAGVRERAADAEAARSLPHESVDAFLEAGIARILMPVRFGGYGLGLETWFEAAREIAKADASHAWCASLIIEHALFVSQLPEEAQKAVWADGPDVAIAASIQPVAVVERTEGGYRISGEFGFTSGVDHCSWLFAGGMVDNDGRPEWTFFLVNSDDFTIKKTWFTGAMQATGSNTAVCQNAFVPESHTVRFSDLREGTGPGGAIHASPIYRSPFIAYAPVSFVTPMLGAAQGAYEAFRESTKTRRGMRGVAIAEITSIQVRLARVGADLDAAELLLRRIMDVAQGEAPVSIELRARAMRDYSRIAEFCVSSIDTLLAMSGTQAFGASNALQRAWRDIHLSAMHLSLNTEANYSHFGRIELGLPLDTHQPVF